MSNGSWQPDPYGRHQLRWWDGAQWSSMVSDNGVTHDENVPQQPIQQPMQQQPYQQQPYQQPMYQQQPMGVPPAGMPPMSPVVMQPTPPKRNNTLIAIVAVVVLAVAGVAVYLVTKDDGGGGKAGTGHDSQTTEGQAYVDAMMQTSGESGLPTEAARCVAEGAIDIVGVQALKDAGITPEKVASGSELLPDFQPTAAQANAMADMMFRCVDFGQMMVDQMGGSSLGLTTDQVRCIGDALEKSAAFRQFIITSMISSSSTTVDTTSIATDMQSELMGIFTSCGIDPSSLGG